jgi:tripartite motif-containing protein 71
MKNHIGKTIVLLFLAALAPFLSLTRAEAAPGDFLFAWGSPPLFQSPNGVAVDGGGNIFVADTGNNRIQKFDRFGTRVTQWGSLGTNTGQFNSPYGVAVDASGNVYVADTSNMRIQKFDNSGFFLTQWGSYGSDDGQFVEPTSIAVDKSGNVYVADNSVRVQKFNGSGTYLTQLGSRNSENGIVSTLAAVAVDGSGNVYLADSDTIQKFDGTGTYLTQWGSYGSDIGQLSFPQGMAVDGNGNLYVADTNNNRIEKFDGSGTFLAQWGSTGNGNGQFQHPVGVAVDGSGKVFVADWNNIRIQEFDGSGSFLAQIGGELANGQFNNPEGLAVDQSGNVYVADRGNQRIQKFDVSGAFLTKWGSYGLGEGQFADPVDLAMDKSGNVYVADYGDLRIEKFDSSGVFLAQWGHPQGYFFEPRAVDVDGNDFVYVLDFISGSVLKFDGSGAAIVDYGNSITGPNNFFHPTDLAADRSGNIYVAIPLNASIHRSDSIYKFDSSGNFLTHWGNFPGSPVAADGSGNVYVFDEDTKAIQVFDGTGTFKGQWGSSGSGNGQFNNPLGIATNESGTIVYVADTFNNRIQAFVGFGTPTTFTLTYAAGVNGTIKGITPQKVNPGGSGTEVTAVANPGYHFVNWTGSNGFVATATNPLIVTNVTASQEITANFAPDGYTLKFSAGPGGAIRGTSPQLVLFGGHSSPVTALPYLGHHFTKWTGDNGFDATRANPLTVKNVRASQNITANFAINKYTVTFEEGPHGSIAGKERQLVSYGGKTTPVIAVPAHGYHFVNWTDEHNRVVSTCNTLTLKNVTDRHRITAHFSR